MNGKSGRGRKPKTYKKKTATKVSNTKAISRIAIKAVQDKVLEKKQLEFSSANRPVGALSFATATGTANAFNTIGPINYIAQGTNDGHRISNRIRPYSFNLKGSIVGQTNYNANVRVKLMLIYYNDWDNTSAGDFQSSLYDGQLFNLNTVGVIDSRCTRNTDYQENYTILKTMSIKLPFKSYAGQQVSTDFNFYYKWPSSAVVDRYIGSANTDLVGRALYVLMVADYGNIGANSYTPATANIPIVPNYSGVNVEYMGKYCFTDA